MHDKLTEDPVQTELTKLTVQGERPRKRSSARPIIIVVLIALAIGGVIAWRTTHKTTAAAGRGGRARGGDQTDAANRGVPVIVSAAQGRDLPIYLDGLGSVGAFNTVTVKSRVDGELTEVHFTEGQDVKTGELLAVIDPRPYQVALAQAKANLAKDQAQLSDAKLNADRYNSLVKQGIIPQQQYDTQAALAGQLEAATQADQAQIDSAQLNITYSHITSPIDGRVGLRLVDAGNVVHASDPNGLLVITQMQPIAVIFTLPEDSLPEVNSRMRGGVPMQVKALTRDNGTELASGTLLTIDNQIDQTTGTFRLKAVFDNKERVLWPNQFVNARLLLDVKRNSIVVPSAAVQHGSDGTFVYTIKQDNTAEVRPVTVGVTEGNVSSIEKGLAANESVVTDGQDRLRAGIVVDARPDTRQYGASVSTTAADAQTPAAAPGTATQAPIVPPQPGGQSFKASDPQGGQQYRQSGGRQGSQSGGGKRRKQQQ
jgi:membrane fusion protein, multidrug efflux system